MVTQPPTEKRMVTKPGQLLLNQKHLSGQHWSFIPQSEPERVACCGSKRDTGGWGGNQ